MSGGVKKLAQVVVGAVIGFVQGGPVGAVIGAGLAFYAAEQQEKLNTKSPLRDNEPSAQTVRSSKAPVRYILGRVSTGGVLVWAQEERGAQTTGEWLHLVYVLCEGAIDELEYIYLGEELIGSYGADASYELVVNPTQVNTFLKENCPDWKDTQIGRGLSYVRISLRYGAEKFPSGIPDARFVVRGRNDIFDPRTGRSGWTENTALHLLWFLRTRCGVPDDEIVFETFASGANVCNESVQNPDGSSSPRYRSGCVIGADEQRTNVLQKLEAACAGKLIRVGGRWMFQAGAYYGPYDFEITEDMVIGTITGNTEATNDAAINTIRGTFIDPQQSWTETDYPEVAVAQWVEEDGGEAAETLSFSYVSDPYQAQRLANIELRRRRSGGALNIPLNLAGYNCRPGRAVRVNLPSLNILGEFMVTNWSMGTSEGCTASVQAYEAAIFDDAVGKPYNPIGFIKLPAGGLGSPTNLRWEVEDAAEISQGVLSWDRPAGIVSGFAVTVRQAGTAVQALQVPETTTRMPISGLTSGSYTMGVAALGPLARSGEATITVDVNGPPMPETCAVQATIDTITLIPGNTLHGLNGGTYEYFWSPDPAATQGEFLGRGLSITHTGLSFAKSYAYFVRSKNAYGVSAFLKVVAATSMDVGAILEGIKGKITESELGKELTSKIEKIALIDGNGPGSVNERIGTAKTELAKQISDVNNALGTVKGNLEQQITAVSADVSAAKTELQQQIANVSAMAGSLPYRKDKAYSVGQSALGSDGKLYQALKAVPLNTPPPNATYWTDVGQAVVTANGMAARVSKVETDVSTLDGKVTAQASQISGLQSSLTTTNGNVSAAQQAAQDAATLAGGKGKVIVQSAAPAVADRLVQNLWIDTTSNANTPKRWNGSAWVAVTDKVATDAAAAAAGALALAQTKADASVVSSLTTRVSDAEGKLTSQATKLDGMQTSIDGKASSQALQQVTSRVTATEDKDKAQDQLISSQSQALTSLTDSVSKKADASTVQALSNEVKTQGQNQTAQGQALTRIDTKLLASQDNSPTKVYQSVFSDMAQDQWVSTNSGAGSSASFGTPTGITRGAALILDGGAGNRTWWGASTRKIRFDPSRLYKLTARVQQLSISGGTPLTYLGLDCFAEDGVTRVTTAGGTGVGSAHYVLMNSRQLSAGEWVTVEAYVKGYSATGEDGGSGAGTVTDPKRLKTGVAWFSPLVIAGYNGMGGRLVVDLFDIEDATEQAQIDAGAMATTALIGRVEKNEQGLTSVSSQTTLLSNSLTTTSQKVDTAQKAAQDAASLAGSKGKILVQSSAPAASDRQEQNLWIDITGNANTPKRWSGSAWLAVTDKVATEAAAAAASALAEVAKKADASALQTLGSKVDQQGKDLTATSSNLVSLGSVIARALDNSPTKVYQSVFSDLSTDQWVSTNSGTGAAASFGAPSGITRGAALILNGGSANKTWWGASTRKIRFDPSRLYKLIVRVQQVLMGAGEPGTYAGVDCFAEDGVTRVATHGGNSVGSSHYVLMTNRKLSAREWVTAEVYVKGFTASGEGGGSGAGTVADPKRLKEGTAWFSPMVVAGYNDAGGQLVVDFFDIEDATEQAQVDANAAATSALTAKVSQNEQGLNSASRQLTELSNSVGTVAAQQAATSKAVDSLSSGVLQQAGILSGVSARTTTLENSLTTTGQNVTAAQQAADAANALAGGKGKVIIQAAAPAVADRLAQNLWIDTIGNANTPKRWSGSAWVAVTDKAATDAAAAAQSALSQVATKAEASALQSLTNRVDAAEGVNISQSASLINLSNNVGAIQNALGASGLDPAPGAYWQFDVGAEGWVGANANTAVSGGSLRLTPTSTNPQLLTSSGALTLSIAGAQYTKVRVGLTRRGGAATSWTGTLYYSTTTHGILSAYRASAANPNIAVGQSAVVEWDMANLAVGGTDWVESTIGRLRFDFANALDSVWDVDWIAVGRVGPSASSRVVESLTSTVTQQGDKLTAEAQRIDGLYTSVGNANAAIQSEASTRASAVTAMGKRVDGVQSSLGSTNAAVQQISTAQTGLNNKVNASYSVRLQVVNGNQYVAAGFGVGVENDGGVLQSTFAVMADRFAVLNPSGNGFVSPFAIQNGQVFLNEAFISTATIQRAIVGNSINSSELANNGVPIMRMDFASGTIIMQNKAASAYTVFNRSGIDMVINGVRRIRMGEW
ncbi:phage tail tip fiber protein [Pseudomonas fulva]|uniref:phage tail protein n=1 Tax=Pseudomonas fulva TaxID=47880 RepID=UPI003F92907E